LGPKLVTRDELVILLCKVEATINSRPLTFVGGDAPQPLSTSHFLLNRRDLYQTKTELPIDDRQTLLDHDKVRLDVLNKFWAIWHKEYLRNLPVTVSKLANRGSLKVGQIVIVREDNMPRMSWPLAKVEKMYMSNDGVCRSVLVRTKNGLFTRAIQRLHSLEIVDSSTLNVNEPEVQVNDTDIENVDSVESDDVHVKTDKDQMSTSTRCGRIVKKVHKMNL